MSLNFKTKVPQNGFRNITKEEQKKVNTQIAELALRNAIKEVNESLNFCWSTTMLTCLGLFDPEMLKIFEEKFKQSIEVLKKSNPLGVENEEEMKKILDIDQVVNDCATPYLQTISAVIAAFNQATKKNES